MTVLPAFLLLVFFHLNICPSLAASVAQGAQGPSRAPENLPTHFGTTHTNLRRRTYISRPSCGDNNDIRYWIIRSVLTEIQHWAELSSRSIRTLPSHASQDERDFRQTFRDVRPSTLAKIAYRYDALYHEIGSLRGRRTLLICGTFDQCRRDESLWFVTKTDQNQIILVSCLSF